MSSDILTRNQATVLHQINWFGDVERAYGTPIPSGCTHDENEVERRYRREIRRLTRRGYLSGGRLTKRGSRVVQAELWMIPSLRNYIVASGSTRRAKRRSKQ